MKSIIQRLLPRLSRVERELAASYVSWEDLEDNAQERHRRIRRYVELGINVPFTWVEWLLQERELNGLAA